MPQQHHKRRQSQKPDQITSLPTRSRRRVASRDREDQIDGWIGYQADFEIQGWEEHWIGSQIFRFFNDYGSGFRVGFSAFW